MSNDLEQLRSELAKVLEADGATVSAARFIDPEVLFWAQGGNSYLGNEPDFYGERDIKRFLSHWENNVHYEIMLNADFEGWTGVAVEGDYAQDEVAHIALYGIRNTDIPDVTLHVELLRHAANWLEAHAETVLAGKDGTITLPNVEPVAGGNPFLAIA